MYHDFRGFSSLPYTQQILNEQKEYIVRQLTKDKLHSSLVSKNLEKDERDRAIDKENEREKMLQDTIDILSTGFRDLSEALKKFD